MSRKFKTPDYQATLNQTISLGEALLSNHLACCYHAWLSLKVKALQLNKTLYQIKADLLRDYLRAELQNPRVPALQPA